MENFDSSLAEILEVDTVSMDAELASFECWDSLTILSIIAFAGEKYRRGPVGRAGQRCDDRRRAESVD